MRPTSILVCALVLFTSVPRVNAQQRGEPPEVWREYAERLPSGALVRLTLRSGAHVKGHVIQVTPDALRVNPKTRIPVAFRDFRYGDIESIATLKEGKSPGQKVLIGAGVAAAAIVGVFLLVVASISN